MACESLGVGVESIVACGESGGGCSTSEASALSKLAELSRNDSCALSPSTVLGPLCTGGCTSKCSNALAQYSPQLVGARTCTRYKPARAP